MWGDTYILQPTFLRTFRYLQTSIWARYVLRITRTRHTLRTTKPIQLQQKQSMAINDQSGSTPSHVVYNVMPRPGQSGALHFDGNNISEFLDDWNLECDDKAQHLGLMSSMACHND